MLPITDLDHSQSKLQRRHVMLDAQTLMTSLMAFSRVMSSS